MVARYKSIYIKNQYVYILAKKQLEIEIYSKHIIYNSLKVNLTRNMKDLCAKNCKTLGVRFKKT